MSDNRQPAGTSIGGQWAPGSAGEVEDSLGGESPYDRYTHGYGLTEEQRTTIEDKLAYIDSEADVRDATDRAKSSMASITQVPELADKDLQNFDAQPHGTLHYTITASYDEQMDEETIGMPVGDAGARFETSEGNTTITFPQAHVDQCADQVRDAREYDNAHARFQAFHQLRRSPATRSPWSVAGATGDEERQFLADYRFHAQSDEERRQMIADRWARGWPKENGPVPECPATGKERL